ncbi:MAG: ABC transporter permease [Spirochaetaceae bacterium]|nr:MAG: ABC transporter permease [Spirochaetaceae bacterium]
MIEVQPSRAVLRNRVAQVRTVLAKELTELFRDWRTILVSVAVPLVLFPLLASLAFVRGEASYGRPSIAIVGEDQLAIVPFLESLDRYELVSVGHAEAAEAGVGSGEYGMALRIHELGTVVELIYNSAESQSADLTTGVRTALQQYSTAMSARRLDELGLATDVLTPIVLQSRPLHHGPRAAGTLALSLLVPVLALLSAAIGPMAAAGDLGAGEKERGTIEPLFGTCAGRGAIVVGKFIAVTVMAIIGVVSFFVGAWLAYLAGPVLHDAVQLEFWVEWQTVSATAILLVLTATLFSAIELAVSLSARSPKAAQAYFLPVLILASASGYGAIAISNPPSWYAHVPLLNVGLALKGAISGVPFSPVIVALWALGYITLALTIASAVVRSETVLRRG